MGDRPAPDEAAQHHLKVVVWSATNVCDVGQVADPHVKLHVLHGGALHREVQRTPTVRNNREPEWDAPFLLHAPSLADASLVLSVYDTDQLSADDLLAYIVLPMSALASDAQLAAAGGGSTTSVFSENSTESPVPEAEPRNFELQLRPSNAQIKRHESMSLFGARSTADRESFLGAAAADALPLRVLDFVVKSDVQGSAPAQQVLPQHLQRFRKARKVTKPGRFGL